jgi:Rad3-related DNA helicase
MEPVNSNETLRYASDPVHEATGNRLQLPPASAEQPLKQRSREVLRIAEEAFSQTGSWVEFYREMLGADGIVRKLFPEAEEMRAFERSGEFEELQEMIAALRSQDQSKGDATEPERMITIRLPKSLHDSLRIESDELNLSINKLCISKLLQRIESRFIPIQQGRRRGRRPGPQGPRKKQSAAASTAGQNGSASESVRDDV